MGFKLVKATSFWWPVKVKLAVDGGRYDSQRFDVQFKRMTVEELAGLRSDDDVSGIELCRKLVLDWKDVNDEEGKPIPFSVTSLNELLNVTGVASAILSAFGEAVSAAQVKN